MALKWRRKLLLAALEREIGVAETLGAGDLIQARDIQFTPLAGDGVIERRLDLAYSANTGAIPGVTHGVLELAVPLAASGVRGTAPPWADLLVACNAQVTETAGTSVVVTPTTESAVPVPGMTPLVARAVSYPYGVPAAGRWSVRVRRKSLNLWGWAAPRNTVDWGFPQYNRAILCFGNPAYTALDGNIPSGSQDPARYFDAPGALRVRSGTIDVSINLSGYTTVNGVGSGMFEIASAPQSGLGTVSEESWFTFGDQEPATPGSTMTLGLNIAGQLHTLTGCRGTFSLELASNQIPLLRFRFVGNYNTPTATALPADLSAYAADVARWKEPLIPSHAATPTATWTWRPAGAQNDTVRPLPLHSLRYDHNVDVRHRDLPGQTPENFVAGRKPAGSMVIDHEALSTIAPKVNWVEESRALTTGALRIVHGTVAGTIVTIDAPRVELRPLEFGERRGIWTSEIPLAFTPTAAGDDEIKITLT